MYKYYINSLKNVLLTGSLESKFKNKNKFYQWLNNRFNSVDKDRIKLIGRELAAAEWLIKNGAKVKWTNSENWFDNYDCLSKVDNRLKIVAILAVNSSIMSVGFPYLENLKNIRSIEFKCCHYLDDKSLDLLKLIKSSLERIELISCSNITDNGVKYLKDLNLKYIKIFDLPSVKKPEKCLSELKEYMPNCEIYWKF